VRPAVVADDPPRPPAHGRRRTYQRGCRCTPCRAANAAYVQAGRLGTRKPRPPLVSAKDAKAHLKHLQAQGVGHRQAARLCGLSSRLIREVRSGDRKTITADLRGRILDIPPILARGATITGWRTWRLIDSLHREGFTFRALAARLHASTLPGRPRPGAPDRRTGVIRNHHQPVRVRSALRVRALWTQINAEGPELAPVEPGGPRREID